MSTLIAVDEILEGREANQLRESFATWRSALRAAQPDTVIDLDEASQPVGVRIDLDDPPPRFLAAWLLQHVLDVPAEEVTVAVAVSEGDFVLLRQFVPIADSQELLAVARGPSARACLKAVVVAAREYRDERFDGDGFLTSPDDPANS